MKKFAGAVVFVFGCAVVLLACLNPFSIVWVIFFDGPRALGHGDIRIDLSPDDRRIVFNAVGAGGRDLFLLQLDDMRVTRVAETDAYEFSPEFSPDGQIVVYAAGVPGDRADHIFTIGIDGQNPQQLTFGDFHDVDPSYSPDGSQVVFARDKTYNWGGLASHWDNAGAICVVNADSSGERELVPQTQQAWQPRFSADGGSIIYSCEDGLYRLPVDGSAEPQQLGPAVGNFSLTPDGTSILFSDGQYASDQEIYHSQLDGSDRVQITDSDKGNYSVLLDSRAKTLYFLTEQWPDGLSGHPRSNIGTVKIDGSEQSPLTNWKLFDDPLHWMPPPRQQD